MDSVRAGIAGGKRRMTLDRSSHQLKRDEPRIGVLRNKNVQTSMGNAVNFTAMYTSQLVRLMTVKNANPMKHIQ